jgi:arsenite-transporting ATPase
MSEIDVEPVEDATDEESTGEGSSDEADSPDLEGREEPTVSVERIATDAPEYVLYGGKGGVGKTTMAAATALASASTGTRTLVVSTDPAHSLSDTFETSIPAEPARIRDDVPLYGAEIDPDRAVEEANEVFTGEAGPGGIGTELGGMAEGLDEDAMDGLLGGTMPGADEAAAMQQLLELLDDDRFDRVVVDTAPTGHTLRLLELPEVMDSMVGRMMKLRERFGGMMDSMKGMFPGGEGEDPAEMGDSKQLEELSDRIERLRSTLRDPSKTDFRVVMVPEEMSVVESQRLLEQLAAFEIPVGTVVVNKVMEDLVDVIDADDLEAELLTPNQAHCDFCARRWEVQQDALASAQDIFRGHEIKRVPLFADEVRGVETLRVVARCLE